MNQSLTEYRAFACFKNQKTTDLLSSIYEIISEHESKMLKSIFELWKESNYEFCQDQTVHFFIKFGMSKTCQISREKIGKQQKSSYVILIHPTFVKLVFVYVYLIFESVLKFCDKNFAARVGSKET